MPLNILLPMVIIGISLIGVLTHVLGYSRKFTISDDNVARQRWLREFAPERVRRVLRARNGEAALIETDSGHGLVWAFGADTVAHRIDGADVEECDDGLILKLHDFAAPHVHVTLDAQEADNWRRAMEGLKQ